MEVYIEVFAESMPSLTKIKTHDAFYTFVAIDKNNKPIEVEGVTPQTEQEQKLYEGALRRRQLRLRGRVLLPPVESAVIRLPTSMLRWVITPSNGATTC